MIPALASVLFAAFPVRGSLLQTLDSAFVLDRDTVRVSYEPCTCLCPSGSYRVGFSTDSSVGVQRFPATTYPNGSPVLAQSAGQYQGTDASGMFPICSTTIRIPPVDARKFLLRGRSGVWAVWADSVYPWTSIIRTFDTSNGNISSSTQRKETFKARWRWSRVDTAFSYVRWVDTVQLRNGAAPVGLPILTTLNPTTFGYLAPESQMAHLGLVLRDLTDTAAPIDWGYRDRLLPTPGLVPAGRTFRVLDAYNPNGGGVRWELTANGKTMDQFLVIGQATAEISGLRRSGPVRWGRVGHEVSTGRTIRLEVPRLVGPQIFIDASGARMIVVE